LHSSDSLTLTYHHTAALTDISAIQCISYSIAPLLGAWLSLIGQSIRLSGSDRRTHAQTANGNSDRNSNIDFAGVNESNFPTMFLLLLVLVSTAIVFKNRFEEFSLSPNQDSGTLIRFGESNMQHHYDQVREIEARYWQTRA
jgi:hypothetical protein